MAENSEIWGSAYYQYAESFLSFLVDPSDRLFFVYLISSFLVAFILYKKSKSDDGLFRFIFPESVWNHPSAWLDVRYFLFHGFFGLFIVHLLTAGVFVGGLSLTLSPAVSDNLVEAASVGLVYRVAMAFFALAVLTVIADFLAFYLHYLQHKIPLLWQFHKVHHSGEVMHPLTNFREHPIDNLVYKLVIGTISGLSWGLVLTIMGFKPDGTTVFILGLTSLAFNLVGYQLRHSHMWLKWPGVWSKVFASPAHHHVHHSRHPDHLDKNFAFMLPVWDVLFKTYQMPENNQDVEFGIVEDSSDLNSCINLYIIPFRDAFRIIRDGKQKRETSLVRADLPLTDIALPKGSMSNATVD